MLKARQAIMVNFARGETSVSISEALWAGSQQVVGNRPACPARNGRRDNFMRGADNGHVDAARGVMNADDGADREPVMCGVMALLEHRQLH